MDSRRNSFHRDATNLSRDSSSRSRNFDVTQHSARSSIRDGAASQSGSPSGYDRGYATRDAGQLNARYQEIQTNDVASQGDSLRRISFHRDATNLSRDSSSRSRSFDVTRHLARSSIRDGAASQGGSPSGYDRGYSTYDARQRSIGMIASSSNDAVVPTLLARSGETSSGSEIPLGYQEGLMGGGKLKNHHWSELESRLKDIRRNFNSLEERKQRNGNNDNDKEVTELKDNINSSLNKLRSKVNNYESKGDDDDYLWLDKIDDRIPKSADEAAFLDGINMGLDYVENGKKELED